MGMERMLMKAIDTKFSSDYSGKAIVQEGTLKVSVPTDTRNKIKCNHSTDYMDITITSNDRFIVDHIMVEVADL